MEKEELRLFLVENKKQFDQAAEEFEKHSREFDRKVIKILSML